MATQTQALPADLSALRDQFTEWRDTRPYKRSPIPRELLVDAQQLTRIHNTNLILGTLGINYAQLQRVKPAS